MNKTSKKETYANKISNFKRNNSIDMTLLIVVVILLGFGIVMILSASAPSALAEFNDSYKYVKRQIIAVVIGIIIMFVLSKIDYRFYKKHYVFIYIVSVLSIFLVKIPGLGTTVNGALRWINLRITTIQPSEITKIGLIISLAGYFSDPKINMNSFVMKYIVPLVFTLIPIVLLRFVQNHLSAGLVIGVVSLVILLMSGCKIKHLLTFFTTSLVLAGIAFLAFKDKLMGSFRVDRMQAWRDPFADPKGVGYQTIQSLYAIGSGNLFGVGLGGSKQKYLYIPEAHNDFIFSIIAEELGFVGCAAVLILFGVFAWRGVSISINAKDLFGSLIAIGITTLIIFQALLNISVVTNVLPNTGVSLPFLSYGGSSVTILLAGIGVLLNISKSAKKV